MPAPAIGAAGGQALTAAQTAAAAPFSMPVAPVSPFTPFQTQAFNQVQGAQGLTNPYFAAATGYLGNSAAPITGSDVAQYYNPFAANVTANLKDIFGQQQSNMTADAIRNAGGV